MNVNQIIEKANNLNPKPETKEKDKPKFEATYSVFETLKTTVGTRNDGEPNEVAVAIEASSHHVRRFSVFFPNRDARPGRLYVRTGEEIDATIALLQRAKQTIEEEQRADSERQAEYAARQKNKGPFQRPTGPAKLKPAQGK